jgi:hypothetical protein
VLTGFMSLNGEYAPSPSKWVRDQVQEYEGSGGTAGTTMRDMPVIIVTTRGAKSGKLRKVPLMRVEPRWRVCRGGLAGWRSQEPGLVLQPHR